MYRAIQPVHAAAYTAAVLAWLACFRLLVQFGTWLPFVAAGSLLGLFALLSDKGMLELLRPTLRRAALGIAGGAVMIAGTYGGFALLRRVLPALHEQTELLYALLRAGAFSDIQRGVLIFAVAASEEVIFRGSMFEDESSIGGSRLAPGLPLTSLSRVALFGALYGVTAAASGSILLVLVAVICGIYWGVLRVVSRSVFAPIVAHVAWDLSILVFWPLV